MINILILIIVIAILISFTRQINDIKYQLNYIEIVLLKRNNIIEDKK